MSNSQQISDLLKVTKDIPILHTGLNDTAIEYSTYPVKEHTQLLNSSGKPMSTPLNSLLTMRNGMDLLESDKIGKSIFPKYSSSQSDSQPKRNAIHNGTNA